MSNIICAAARSVNMSGRLNPCSAAGRRLLIPSHRAPWPARPAPAGGRGSSPSPSLELEVIPIGQGVHVNRCERNQSWPGSPLSLSPLPLHPPLPLLFLLPQGDCHMIAKKWHINEAPLQGSFLLLSPLKTIRWFEGGHGGSHLAQWSRGAHSSALRNPEAAAATVRAGTPPPSSAARGAHGQKRHGPGGAGRCGSELRSSGTSGAQPRQDTAPRLRAGRDSASSSAIPDADAQLGATLR